MSVHEAPVKRDCVAVQSVDLDSQQCIHPQSASDCRLCLDLIPNRHSIGWASVLAVCDSVHALCTQVWMW